MKFEINSNYKLYDINNLVNMDNSVNKSKVDKTKTKVALVELVDPVVSLDDEEVPKVEYFYFKSKNSNHIYEVPTNTLPLCKHFEELYNISPLDYQKDTPYELLSVVHPDEYTMREYKINTEWLLFYVEKYMLLWRDNPQDANYVKVKKCKASDINQFLVKRDSDFIKEYLNDRIVNKELGLDIDVALYNRSANYKTKIDFYLLSHLLMQVDQYLNMESLANKIYTWCAVSIYNKSITDFYEILDDPYFKQLSNETTDKYLEESDTE